MRQNFPEHVAAAWTGHSATVGRKHYAMITDEDMERAAGTNQKAVATPRAVKSGVRRERNRKKPNVNRTTRRTASSSALHQNQACFDAQCGQSDAESANGPPGFEPGTKRL